MPQESSPMWFGVAAGLHLGNFRAVQLGFSLLLVLPAASWNSSSAKPLSPNLQGFKFGGLGFVGAIRTHKVTSYPNPSPPHVQPPPAADFSELCLISPPTLSLTGTSGGPPRRQ